MRILFLTQICPYPPTNGGAIKTYNILKHLGARHEVDLLLFVRNESEIASLIHLGEYCRRMESCVMPRSPFLDLTHATRSLLARRSFIIARDQRPEMQSKVLEYLHPMPDLIYVDHLQMFQYVPVSTIVTGSCPVVLDEHNVEWRIIERFAEYDASLARRLFASIEWPKLRRFELDACRSASAVLTVTEHDRRTLQGHGVPDEKLTALPIGVDAGYFTPLPRQANSRRILTFGTMSWPPNTDAVQWFHREVYPSVKRQAPEAEFVVVGPNPPPAINQLPERDRSVTVTGYVDDIRQASINAAVFVVPLRVGSGMRVKILDAMAMGLPVISTSIGCEGISVHPGKDIVVADGPAEFAGAVVHLLENPSERARIGSAGRRLVESEYSWPSILTRLDDLLSDISQRHR